MRLPTPGGIERRGIQSHPAALLDRHDGGVERPALGVTQIDAIGIGSRTHGPQVWPVEAGGPNKTGDGRSVRRCCH